MMAYGMSCCILLSKAMDTMAPMVARITTLYTDMPIYLRATKCMGDHPLYILTILYMNTIAPMVARITTLGLGLPLSTEQDMEYIRLGSRSGLEINFLNQWQLSPV